jgi:hypothetical protein
MSRLASTVSQNDFEHRPVPFLSIVLGLLVATNVASAAAMLLAV